MPATPRALLRTLKLITDVALPRMGNSSPIQAAHIQKVRAAFEDPNILGIGIGNKVVGGADIGTSCICFYVNRKRASNRIPAGYAIPPVLAGSDGRATFTDVKVMGNSFHRLPH